MLSLLFGGNRKTKIGVLELDASITELHEFENVVTAYPVEDGGEVADHIYMKPDTVMVQGFVTNSPPLIFDITLGRSDRVGDALETLLTIRNNRELVTVVTGLKVYNNMALKRLSIPRTRTTGNSIRFTADFVKVTKVASETAEIPGENLPPDNEQVQDQAPSPVDAGVQSTTPTSTQSGQRSSILAEIFN